MMSASQDEARMLLRAWRHLDYNAPDNFAILGSDSIMALWHDLTGNLAFVAMALVSVFLVVGGIVIMNIMLASVTERTREIGLRRSLGARKAHILLQFLTESAVLAACGGFIGILTAYLAVYLVNSTHRCNSLALLIHGCGTFLRHLPGHAGCKTRSHRSSSSGKLGALCLKPTAKISDKPWMPFAPTNSAAPSPSLASFSVSA
jgi:ABC-type antimicrobial peptide transport system permease subunit